MGVIGKIVGREKKVNDRFDRQILIGMIISTEFLKGILPIYKDNFQIPFAKTIASWIIEYYDQYQLAPKEHIEDIFKNKKDSLPDQDEVEMVEEFLLGLSSEYVKGEKFNSQYILDQAEIHFRKIELNNTVQKVKKALVRGEIEEAEALIQGFERVVRTKTKGVDPICDVNIIADALNPESGDVLFNFSGELGKQIGPLKRGYLVSFMGNPGVGKTWWLMYSALKALFSGLNVVFISMEMSERQMVERIQHYVTGLPNKKWVGKIKIPVLNCLRKQDGTCTKVRQNSPYCKRCQGTPDFIFGTSLKDESKKSKSDTNNTKPRERLTIQKAIKKSKAVKALLRGNSFKLITFPSRTATMNDINAYLYNLEHYDNFIPDVIVTDYADKVKPEDSHDQYRHQISKIWEGHKALAQQKNCAVITASQSNTGRTGGEVKQGSWAEAIAKLELSDIGIGLNSSDDNKEKGVMVCTILKQRHDEFFLNWKIAVLYNFKIGKAYLDSALMPLDEKDKDKE